MKELPYRQIHLDFHTSPFISDVASEFNGVEFAKTLKKAKVNSINVFAKCHHGMSYYPTKVGVVHPSLKFDLLGEMLKALHNEGIEAPIYFPVGWEETSADNANWLEVSRDGVLGGISPFEEGNYKWRKLCLNKPGYVDFVLKQTQEIIDNYQVDGIWYDIIFQNNCCCSDCIKSMKQLGMNPENKEDVDKHDLIVLNRFTKKAYEYVRERLPEALMFFNGSFAPDGGYDPEVNILERAKYMTHMEIESLPSELWGYNHFPYLVNYHNALDKQIIGMNGKFHTAWGDFGSLRNEEALEFECFRMIMNGAKCCIGDQLHPRGKLDEAVYERIGKVYKQIEAREPWCTNSKKLSEIGVIVSRDVKNKIQEADEGVMRMLLELHYAFDFIDISMDFSKYKLVILPDKVVGSEKLEKKLSSFVKNGGKVLATYQSTLNEEKTSFNFKEMSVEYLREDEFNPSYIVLGEEILGEIPPMEYVMYERGAVVKALENTENLAMLGKPYFNRTYDRFCSHRHFPFEKVTENPAIVESSNAIYITNPLFTDYINFGVRVYRDIISNCIKRLLPEPMVKTELPFSAEITLRNQGDRTILHILHYIAERKSRKIDIVDTKIPLYGQKIEIKKEKAPSKVYLAPSLEGIPFIFKDGYVKFTVPEINGHTMVVLE